jgi:hypothetical protein
MRIIILFIALPFFQAFGQSFPNDWIGEYEGQMILGNANRPNDTVSVFLVIEEVEADSIWTYKMTYRSPKWNEIIKDYRIVKSYKEESPEYMLDEQNGIGMELAYMNNTFYGMYEVMEAYFYSSMRFVEDELMIELICSSTKNPTVSGTTDDPETEKNEAIKVKSFKPFLHQTVFLTRTK